MPRYITPDFEKADIAVSRPLITHGATEGGRSAMLVGRENVAYVPSHVEIDVSAFLIRRVRRADSVLPVGLDVGRKYLPRRHDTIAQNLEMKLM